jgi:hypothetical protein
MASTHNIKNTMAPNLQTTARRLHAKQDYLCQETNSPWLPLAGQDARKHKTLPEEGEEQPPEE